MVELGIDGYIYKNVPAKLSLLTPILLYRSNVKFSRRAPLHSVQKSSATD